MQIASRSVPAPPSFAPRRSGAQQLRSRAPLRRRRESAAFQPVAVARAGGPRRRARHGARAAANLARHLQPRCHVRRTRAAAARAAARAGVRLTRCVAPPLAAPQLLGGRHARRLSHLQHRGACGDAAPRAASLRSRRAAATGARGGLRFRALLTRQRPRRPASAATRSAAVPSGARAAHAAPAGSFPPRVAGLFARALDPLGRG